MGRGGPTTTHATVCKVAAIITIAIPVSSFPWILPSLEADFSGDGPNLLMTGTKVFIHHRRRLRTAIVVEANDCCLWKVCAEVF